MGAASLSPHVHVLEWAWGGSEGAAIPLGGLGTPTSHSHHVRWSLH